MNMFFKIATLLTVNALGFFSPFACYLIGIKTGALDLSDPAFDVDGFRTWFLSGIMLAWAVCALFSLSFLILRGSARFVFLWAPLVVPLVYGLSVLYAPFFSSL